jgi:hypothetical protein
MPVKHFTRLAALASLAAAGLLLALTINTKPAYAYSIIDLPNMGFGVLSIGLANGCHQYKVGWHNDNKTDLGSDCASDFQSRLDAFVASHCPPYVCPGSTVTVATTATSVQTTTLTQTTTETVTEPAPPAVTTMQTVAVVHEVPSPFVDDDPPAYVAPSPPNASFAESTKGLSVTLADESNVSSVTWSFGDGANGAGSTITHHFTAAGDYTIIETVIDANGLAAQAERTVTVAPLPTRLVKLLPLG